MKRLRDTLPMLLALLVLAMAVVMLDMRWWL